MQTSGASHRGSHTLSTISDYYSFQEEYSPCTVQKEQQRVIKLVYFLPWLAIKSPRAGGEVCGMVVSIMRRENILRVSKNDDRRNVKIQCASVKQ